MPIDEQDLTCTRRATWPKEGERGDTMHERSARVGPVTGRRPVSDSMVRTPKTLPITTTVGEIRRAFGSGHVHMVLLVHRGMLITTVERDDIGEEMADHSAAGTLAMSHTAQRKTVWPSWRRVGQDASPSR